MVKVRRLNVFLNIPEGDIDKYMAQGYSVVDDFGRVIRQSVPTDVNSLKVAYEQHTKEIATLKAENQSLKTEMSLLKKQLSTAANPPAAPADAVEEKPTRRRTRS